MLTTAKQESREAEVRKRNTTLVYITGAPVVRAGRVDFARQRQGSPDRSKRASALSGRVYPLVGAWVLSEPKPEAKDKIPLPAVCSANIKRQEFAKATLAVVNNSSASRSLSVYAAPSAGE
jgi:hypothetical protein